MHAFLEHADLSILIENPHVLIIDGGLKTVYSGVQFIYFMLESVFLLINPDFIIPVPVKPPDKTHLSRHRQMVAGEGGNIYLYKGQCLPEEGEGIYLCYNVPSIVRDENCSIQ